MLFRSNRLSLFSAQRGRCAVTGEEFLDITEIHCHHKKPRSQGGRDNYRNLTLVLIDVHKLIHATKDLTIKRYMDLLKPTEKQLEKLNSLRTEAGLEIIKVS